MTENTKRYRVPHCNDCDKCKYTQMPWVNTKEYSCYKDTNSSVWGEIIGFLGKNHTPKTSPKWCPKRREKLEDTIQMKTDITLTDKDGNLIEVKSLLPEYLLDSLL